MSPADRLALWMRDEVALLVHYVDVGDRWSAGYHVGRISGHLGATYFDGRDAEWDAHLATLDEWVKVVHAMPMESA